MTRRLVSVPTTALLAAASAAIERTRPVAGAAPPRRAPPATLPNLTGSWVAVRVEIGTRCACGEIVPVETVKASRASRLLAHPETTLTLARQALRVHAREKGCTPPPERPELVTRASQPDKETPSP